MKEPSKKEQIQVANFIKHLMSLKENERKEIYKDMLKQEDERIKRMK